MRPHDENKFLVCVQSEEDGPFVQVQEGASADALAADMLADLNIGDRLYIVPIGYAHTWKAVPKGVELQAVCV